MVIISMLYILLGILAGGLSGLIGVGGGVIIVPALVFLFGMSQQSAQGTTLALLVPPIGILAAMQYYKQGYVDVRVAILIIIGFLIGSVFGSKLAIVLPTKVLSKVFGITMLIIALKMLFSK